jgi:alkyl sulfatase BDS1-like metallo-beta-lactamase superfamily hydrolase
MNPTSGGRNSYLTNARILEGKLGPARLATLQGAQQRILDAPTDILLNLVRYHLDHQKSNNTSMTIGIKLNDTNQGYTLQIRKQYLSLISRSHLSSMWLFTQIHTPLKD